MTDAEQFLADLEAKAKDIKSKMWQAVRKEFFGDISYEVNEEENGGVVAYDLSSEDALFIVAADPTAVLRLVGMVRHLAVGCDAEACQYGHCTPTCRIKMAYAATEEK